MSTVLNVLLLLTPPVAIFVAILTALRSMNKRGNAKRALGTHFLTVAVLTILCLGCTMAVSAAETAEAATTAFTASSTGLAMLSVGLCTGLSGIGGGIALASGVPAAIGATSENPKAFGKALIFVALGETIALYGVIISFMILTKYQ